MNGLLCLLWLSVFLVLPVFSGDDGERVINPDEDDDETQYNLTYAEHQTKLHFDIFATYNRYLVHALGDKLGTEEMPWNPRYNDRNIRPVKEAETTVEVDLHLHVTHVSFNQHEQTMTVHGHMYMSWFDEFIHWDPKDYNGVTTTNVKKWQIWMPEVRVTNSINGLYSTHDINRNSHITVQTYSYNGKDYTKAKVETYPTFSIKVGCLMDFSDYPYDEHSCSIRIFTPKKVREVELNVYRYMPPTMFLSWSNETQMLTSGDFIIHRASNNISYYRYGVNDDLKPITGRDLSKTWSIYNMYIFYRRHSATYFVTIALPLISATTLSLCSLMIKELRRATILNTITFIIHMLFINEFVNICPVSVFEVPRAMFFHGWSISLTIFIFSFHLILCIASTLPDVQRRMIDMYARAYNAIPYTPYPGFMAEFVKDLGNIRTRGWKRNVVVWRTEVCCFLTTLYLILFTQSFLI